MKHKLLLKLKYIVVALIGIFVSGHAFAQITLNTTIASTGYTGTNSSGTNSAITFVIENTTASPILLMDVGDWTVSSDNGAVYTLYYSSTSLSGVPATSFPATGWTAITSSTLSGITAPSLSVNNVLTGINFMIPGNTMYRFALFTTGTRRYSGTGVGTCSPNTFSNSGINLLVGDYQISSAYVGYGFTNGPRFFTGSITFMPATPCSGIPLSGTVTPAGPLTSCAGAQTVLTASGFTLAQNITFQWEESTNGGTTWFPIFGATTKSYAAQPTVTTMYRMMVTCTNSSQSAVTNAVTITVTPPNYLPIPYVQDFETWTNKCSVNDVPTGGNWVNGPPTGSASWRRPNQGTNASWIVPTGGAYAPTGIPTVVNAGSARFHSAYSPVGAVGNLDLYLDFSVLGGAKQLYFYHINNASLYGTVGVDSLNVFYSSNGGATFTWVGGYDTALTWRKRSIPLTSNANSPQVILRFQGKRLAAHNVSDSNTTDIGIDSIVVVGPCSGTPFAGSIQAPASLCAGSSASLLTTGTTMAAGLTFQWEQSTDGTTWVPAVGGQGATTQFFTTPSLYDTISYRLKVNCGTNSSTSAATTINVASPYYANVPYQQSFEQWRFRCALNDVPDSVWASSPATSSASWRRRDQGSNAGWLNATQGATTPLSLANGGLYSARFHSTNAAATTTGELDLLLDCSQQVGTKQVEFHYINPSGDDSLIVWYSSDSGFNFTKLMSYNTTPVWKEERLALPSNSPKTIVRFQGYSDFSKTTGTDLSIDSVRVLQPCNAPISAGTINNLVSVCKYDTFMLYLMGNTQAAGITYDWQQSFDNVNWTSTGVTTFNYTGFIAQPTFFRTLVKCVASNIEDTTPVRFLDTTQFYYCYCNSFATTITGADVGNVQIKSLPGNNTKLNSGVINPPTAITNNPTANKTYTSYIYSLPPATMYRDTSYSLAVTQINSSAFTAARATVWIDKDHSGTFDPNEIVLQKFTSTSSFPPQVVDTSFVLPSTMDTGITGMRVQIEEGTTPANIACGNYTGGETEDYLLRIYYPPCTGASNPGVAEISDTATCIGYTVYVTDTTYDKTHSGLIRVWQQSPDGFSWADIAGSDTMNQIKHVVTAPTYFRMQLVCASPVKLDTTHSNVVHVSINPPVSCYCISQAVGYSKDTSDIGAFYFENFNINVGGPHLKNPEAWRMRTDYTRLPMPELWVDSSYDFTLYHIISSSVHADAKVTIFIDFDADMHYDSPIERVYTGYTSASGYLLNGSIQVPHNALPDIPVGMRVIINNDVAPNSPSDDGCGNYYSGETEDYVVIIRSPLTSGLPIPKSIGHYSLFPNPTSGRFTVSFMTLKSIDEITVTVTNVLGEKIQEKSYGRHAGGATFQEPLNLSEAAKGVYFVELKADQEKIIKKIVVQ